MANRLTAYNPAKNFTDETVKSNNGAQYAPSKTVGTAKTASKISAEGATGMRVNTISSVDSKYIALKMRA
jgi:hypothetical protein